MITFATLRRLQRILFCLSLPMVLTATPTSAQHTPPMDILAPYRWQHRIVIVFADDLQKGKAAGFLASVAARQEDFIDRDMLLVTVHPKKALLADESLPKEALDALQKKYNADGARFRVVLIGKDGGQKLSRVGETELQDIFDLIDTMPMRRQEMRQKKSG